MKQTVDIIGAGIIGLLTAYELSLSGCKVRLFEQNWQGRAASWAGGGICSPLHPWRATPALQHLVDASAGYYQCLQATLKCATGIDIECVQSGMLVLSDSDAAYRWAVSHSSVQSLQHPAQYAFLIEQALQSNEAGYYLPAVEQVRNAKVMQALRAWMQAQDLVTCVRAQVKHIEAQSTGGISIKTENHRFYSECCLVTAGPWTGELLADYGLAEEIYPVKGQMLAIQTPPGWLTRILVTDHIYLVPRQDGLILVGSTLEKTGFNQETTAAAKEWLWARATALMPGLAKFAIIHHWAGLRPGARQIFLGAVPGAPNLYAASGHYRCGLTTAPATAHRLKQLLLETEENATNSDYAWQSEHERTD